MNVTHIIDELREYFFPKSQSEWFLSEGQFFSWVNYYYIHLKEKNGNFRFI